MGTSFLQDKVARSCLKAEHLQNREWLKQTRMEEGSRDNRGQRTCTGPGKTLWLSIKKRKGAEVWGGQYKRMLEVLSRLIHSVLKEEDKILAGEGGRSAEKHIFLVMSQHRGSEAPSPVWTSVWEALHSLEELLTLLKSMTKLLLPSTEPKFHLVSMAIPLRLPTWMPISASFKGDIRDTDILSTGRWAKIIKLSLHRPVMVSMTTRYTHRNSWDFEYF